MNSEVTTSSIETEVVVLCRMEEEYSVLTAMCYYTIASIVMAKCIPYAFSFPRKIENQQLFPNSCLILGV